MLARSGELQYGMKTSAGVMRASLSEASTAASKAAGCGTGRTRMSPSPNTAASSPSLRQQGCHIRLGDPINLCSLAAAKGSLLGLVASRVCMPFAAIWASRAHCHCSWDADVTTGTRFCNMSRQ